MKKSINKWSMRWVPYEQQRLEEPDKRESPEIVGWPSTQCHDLCLLHERITVNYLRPAVHISGVALHFWTYPIMNDYTTVSRTVPHRYKERWYQRYVFKTWSVFHLLAIDFPTTQCASSIASMHQIGLHHITSHVESTMTDNTVWENSAQIICQNFQTDFASSYV